jgi:ABC-2 type transport system permease protein
VLIIVLGLILGFRPGGGALGVLLAFALVLTFSIALSWIWIIFGMKVKTPSR